MRRLFTLAAAGAASILTVLTATAAHAQDPTPPQPLFASDAPLEILLEGPLTTLATRAEISTETYPARLTLLDPAGAQVFDVKINARGLTRRSRDICRFPPLRVDFDKDELADTVFDGQNRLKLVTHCRRQSSYEQLYILEHLAYRIYNLITPESFRIRSAQITYRDSEGRSADVTRFAFFIEDVDDLAARNDGEEHSVNEIARSELAAAPAARFALFAFMIGNLDWSFLGSQGDEECCHNAKLIRPHGSAGGDLVPAPYDFDFSGFVDAEYATPPDTINVTSVRQRRYRGLCRHNAALPDAAAVFQARRSEVMALVENETRLNASNRRRAVRYLEDFYGVLDNERRFESAIIRRCRD